MSDDNTTVQTEQTKQSGVLTAVGRAFSRATQKNVQNTLDVATNTARSIAQSITDPSAHPNTTEEPDRNAEDKGAGEEKSNGGAGDWFKNMSKSGMVLGLIAAIIGLFIGGAGPGGLILAGIFGLVGGFLGSKYMEAHHGDNVMKIKSEKQGTQLDGLLTGQEKQKSKEDQAKLGSDKKLDAKVFDILKEDKTIGQDGIATLDEIKKVLIDNKVEHTDGTLLGNNEKALAQFVNDMANASEHDQVTLNTGEGGGLKLKGLISRNTIVNMKYGGKATQDQVENTTATNGQAPTSKSSTSGKAGGMGTLRL